MKKISKTNAFILKEISPVNFPVLDNMLQLYTHELNEYFNYSIKMDVNARYHIKSAGKLLSNGRGYFVFVGCEYAGFILLNNHTKGQNGVFISEFFILPRYRRGFFYRDVLASLFTQLNGRVEYRILSKNQRALLVFKYLTRRYLSTFQSAEEYENGAEYVRFALDTANITFNISKYKTHII